MKQIKLIWQFFGPDAEGIAIHHATHLQVFQATESKIIKDIGVEIKSNESIAYMIVNEEDMIYFRDKLRPHFACYIN